ncbi:FecR domain-containing protein [Telmatospirillum sp.]|uniref:FecR family protein n=1 Tax=Telmatospirillum sp. TaxID=2079197 RepID=UPI00283E47B6|nr:FecR domain-containing protein [Telmatospirillum sp.]MDR3440372.1 FecR domain-containing protein [Telmatospirillum sp.]
MSGRAAGGAAGNEDDHLIGEAAAWTVRKDEGRSDDLRNLDAWLAADPGHRSAFDKVSATLGDPALTQALANLASKRKVRRQPGRLAVLGAIAACLLAIFVVPAAWPEIDDFFAATDHFETAVGASRVVTLTDGSRLELNGDSSLDVRLSRHHRAVRIKRGEVFFDIAADPQRPFQVSAGLGRITVLGTAFDVDLTTDAVELSVYRGHVRFGLDGAVGETLTAGQKMSLLGETASPETDFDPAAGDWRQGWLDTRGITLGRLAQQLNRRSEEPIAIGDPKLAEIMISGRFRLDDPERLLRNLGAVRGFSVRRTSGRLIVTQVSGSK